MMTVQQYTIYSTVDGYIVSHITCLESDLHLNIKENQAAKHGHIDFERYINLETLADELKPEPPFDLQDARKKKLKHLEARYYKENLSTFSYNGRDYSANQIAQNNLNATANYINRHGAFPPTFPMVWSDVDGNVIPILTPEDFDPLYQAFVDTGGDNFIHYAMLEAQVNSLPETATQADLDAIQW